MPKHKYDQILLAGKKINAEWALFKEELKKQLQSGPPEYVKAVMEAFHPSVGPTKADLKEIAEENGLSDRQLAKLDALRQRLMRIEKSKNAKDNRQKPSSTKMQKLETTSEELLYLAGVSNKKESPALFAIAASHIRPNSMGDETEVRDLRAAEIKREKAMNAIINPAAREIAKNNYLFTENEVKVINDYLNDLKDEHMLNHPGSEEKKKILKKLVGEIKKSNSNVILRDTDLEKVWKTKQDENIEKMNFYMNDHGNVTQFAQIVIKVGNDAIRNASKTAKVSDKHISDLQGFQKQLFDLRNVLNKLALLDERHLEAVGITSKERKKLENDYLELNKEFNKLLDKNATVKNALNKPGLAVNVNDLLTKVTNAREKISSALILANSKGDTAAVKDALKAITYLKFAEEEIKKGRAMDPNDPVAASRIERAKEYADGALLNAGLLADGINKKHLPSAKPAQVKTAASAASSSPPVSPVRRAPAKPVKVAKPVQTAKLPPSEVDVIKSDNQKKLNELKTAYERANKAYLEVKSVLGGDHDSVKWLKATADKIKKSHDQLTKDANNEKNPNKLQSINKKLSSLIVIAQGLENINHIYSKAYEKGLEGSYDLINEKYFQLATAFLNSTPDENNLSEIAKKVPTLVDESLDALTAPPPKMAPPPVHPVATGAPKVANEPFDLDGLLRELTSSDSGTISSPKPKDKGKGKEKESASAPVSPEVKSGKNQKLPKPKELETLKENLSSLAARAVSGKREVEASIKGHASLKTITGILLEARSTDVAKLDARGAQKLARWIEKSNRELETALIFVRDTKAKMAENVVKPSPEPASSSVSVTAKLDDFSVLKKVEAEIKQEMKAKASNFNDNVPPPSSAPPLPPEPKVAGESTGIIGRRLLRNAAASSAPKASETQRVNESPGVKSDNSSNEAAWVEMNKKLETETKKFETEERKPVDSSGTAVKKEEEEKEESPSSSNDPTPRLGKN